jgi:hypothetical protein
MSLEIDFDEVANDFRSSEVDFERVADGFRWLEGGYG